METIEENTESGGVVSITMRYDDGRLWVENEYTMSRPYFSDYWEKKPDGQYELFITQGGIRNQDIPRDEKKRLINFLAEYYEIHDFNGVVKLEKFFEQIAYMRIEPKHYLV